MTDYWLRGALEVVTAYLEVNNNVMLKMLLELPFNFHVCIGIRPYTDILAD